MDLELNIAICDDEKYYRDYVENVVRGYLVKEDVLFQIELFVNGEAFCEDRKSVV